MNKRNLSILFLVCYFALMILSLVSCGSDNVQGMSVTRNISSVNYNEETNKTSMRVDVYVENLNSSKSVRSYQYRLTFRDGSSVVYSKNYQSYESLGPNDGTSVTHWFEESNGTAITGQVSSVDVTPVQMTLSDSDSNSSGTPKWGFWATFWVIVSAILVFLFITCCIGADGDTDAIIGGVVLFIVPAVIILVVYFGFVYGSGV